MRCEQMKYVRNGTGWTTDGINHLPGEAVRRPHKQLRECV
jgi:hypothetical protein